MYGLPDTLFGRLSITQCLLIFLCKFLNSCISFNICPINTKLEDFVNLGFLLLTFGGLLLFIP